MFRDAGVPITDFGDFPTHRKIIAYKKGSTNPDVVFGDQSSASYHGTHTAGTTVGNDDGIGASPNDGMAKAAKLYFEDLSGPLLGTGLDPFLDLNDLFLPSYLGNAGGAARVSSNSWGAPVAGAYDVTSLNTDQFMWNHPDYLIFFANGNSAGSQTVGSPGAAKSVVSMGALQTAPTQMNLATYTSRGPAADGRRKPTIAAVGTLISAMTPPSDYQQISGTSMATPAAAGTSLLLRQYCTEGWYPTGTKVPGNGFTPSAALLKAMCVNSGDMPLKNSSVTLAAPDNNVGYGRIDADIGALLRRRSAPAPAGRLHPGLEHCTKHRVQGECHRRDHPARGDAVLDRLPRQPGHGGPARQQPEPHGLERRDLVPGQRLQRVRHQRRLRPPAAPPTT